ncbi:MAG: hypothetical protein RJA63_337 [Pseudomonadota bacterium]|jgi:hypothetical protein|nr:hypothetical protein [Uliginosibacterium sp.]
MAQFEDHQGDALDISREIARKLIVLGIDWADSRAMREIAHEALRYSADRNNELAERPSRAKLELFGLIGLMLRTMEEGADRGSHIHGSDVWKAMAKALWEEKGQG